LQLDFDAEVGRARLPVPSTPCSLRQLAVTGMSVAVGALSGFFVSYRIACRRFDAGR
jgi:hypothetical protein